MSLFYPHVPAGTFLRHLFPYLSLVIFFSCKSPKVGHTYWFIRSGNWDNSACWRDNLTPGKTIAAADTVHILSTAETGVDSLLDNGVVIVDGGLFIGPNCQVAPGGQMFFSKTSIMQGAGYLGVVGILRFASQAVINFTGTLETVPGGATTNNGEMQCGKLLMGGEFTNGPNGQITIPPNGSAVVSTNSFIDSGSMTVRGSLDLTAAHLTDFGTIRCEQGGALYVDSNCYFASGGLIQLADSSSLNIQNGGRLEVDGRVSTDKNTLINIKGLLTNEGLIQNSGVVVNLGSFLMSAAAEQRAQTVSPQLVILDTFYNGSKFQAAVGKVSGAGPFVNYFGATAQGYSGPTLNYQIIIQPVNFVCQHSPCTGTFNVAAGGGPLSYQWQYKAEGQTWNPVPAKPPFRGTTSATLVVTNPGFPYQTVPYRCQLKGAGPGNVAYTNVVVLMLGAKK